MRYTCLLDEIYFFTHTSGVIRFIREVSKRLFCGVDSCFVYKGYRKSISPTWARNKFLSKLYQDYIWKSEYGFPDLSWEPANRIQLPKQGKKTILTIHDLAVIKYPQWILGSTDYYNKQFLTGLKKADLIITVSDTIRHELIEYAPIVEEKTCFVHHAIDHAIFFPAEEIYTENHGEKYILYVGGLHPRKNLINLLKAYMSLPVNFRKEYKFLLTASEMWLEKEIMEYINKMPEYVVFKGRVSTQELVRLYRNASLLAYVTFYEGMGLPPLEAMACGTPVLVSDMPVIHEICADAATYANPNDIDSIAVQILNITQRDAAQKKEWREKGLQQAAQYTWDKTAEQYKKHFLEVASS